MRYIHPIETISHIDKKEFSGIGGLLINMPIRENAKPNNTPLGLLMLSAMLEKYDIETKILDLNYFRNKDNRFIDFATAKRIIENAIVGKGSPDFIGISGLITTLKWQKQVAQICKQIYKKAHLVSGGGLATQFGTRLFQWIPELDGICTGEGDDIIIKIAYDAKILQNNKPCKTKLMPYLFETNGKYKFVYDGKRPKNLDDLPYPEYTKIEYLDKYISNPIWGEYSKNSSVSYFQSKRSLNIISSRGCPYNCAFCYRGTQGNRKYGCYSAQYICGFMNHITSQHNLDFIGIVDDNFMVDRRRIKEFTYLLRNDITWGTHGRLDDAADVGNIIPRVNLMAASGCKYIGFGAESASPKVLQIMGKGGSMLKNGVRDLNGYKTPRSMIQGYKNTCDAGIQGNCTWIMGFPGETLQDLKTSVNYILWQKENFDYPVNQKMFVATAYPGTRLFNFPNVRAKLQSVFGINFDKNDNLIYDGNLLDYVLQLDNADKLIVVNDRMVNYSNIDDDDFYLAKEYIDNDQIEKIMDL